MAKKKIWVILILVSTSLIIAGTVSVLVKKGSEKTAEHTQSKPASSKPKEEVWDWTFEWEATAEQLASGRQKVIGRIHEAKVIFCNENILKFLYKRSKGKIMSLTLDRSSSNEYLFGRASQDNVYLRVWLLPDEKGNFKGWADNGPARATDRMEIFLKKKL